MINQQNLPPKLALAVGLTIAGAIAIAPPVRGQIMPDESLGLERSQVIPNVMVQGEVSDRVEGGARRGVNLFHSFTDFNVANGQRVYFANPTGINTILTRVTGSNPSNILGRLGVDGTANLFLINPNGILFGPNASLDIRGSFTASTANSLTFPDGEQFSATKPQAPPLLTISVPIGLQYGPRPGQISNAGHLQVGQDLTLAASHVTSTGKLTVPNGNLSIDGVTGDVEIKHLNATSATLSAVQNLNLTESQLVTTGDLNLHAQDAVRIRDSVTTPFIAQAGGKLLIQGNQAVDIFALSHPNSGLFSATDMTLRSSTPIIGDAHYGSNGNFRIEQPDGSLGSLVSPHDPVILANGDVGFLNYQGRSLHVLAGGSVTIPRYVWITGTGPLATTINPITQPVFSTVTLSDGTQLVINGNAQATIDIRAGIDWTQLGGPPGNTNIGGVGTPTFGATATSADINIGTVFFDNTTLSSPIRGNVLLTNQYKPNTALRGSIQVNPTLSGGSFNGTEAILTGDAFRGGLISIDSRGDVLLNGFVAASTLDFNGTYFGDGGDIKILSGRNIVSSSGILSLGLLGGAITFIADEAIAFKNNEIGSVSWSAQAGTAKDIFIKAKSVFLIDGAMVSSATFGQANSGNLKVKADSIFVVGASPDGQRISGLITQTEGNGYAGNLTIDTKNLSLFNGGRVSTITFDQGNAGKLTINASEFIEVAGTSPDGRFQSNIRTDQTTTGAIGNGGDLTISTARLIVRELGQISAGTFGAGNGGDLTITATDFVEVTGAAWLLPSGIFTDVGPQATGKGGNLRIETNRLLVKNGGTISTSTNGIGDAGNLAIKASRVEVTGKPSTSVGSAITTESTLATGNAGNLTIETGQLVIRDGGKVSTTTFGAGNGGLLTVEATHSVELEGSLTLPISDTGLFAQTLGAGNAGDINLEAKQLTVRDGARATTATAGSGRAGNLTVKVSDIDLTGVSATNGSSLLGTDVAATGTGRGGNLLIETDRLTVQDGARITSGTHGAGDAGSLMIDARESITLIGTSRDRPPSGLFTPTEGSGNAGSLKIATKTLTVQNGGQISSTTQGTGRGGDISITASDAVTVLGASANDVPSVITTESSLSPNLGQGGNSGNITISTKQLTVQSLEEVGEAADGSTFVIASISSQTLSQGKGGNLTIHASDSIQVLGSGAALGAGTQSLGNGGEINLSTKTLTVQNGGLISASTNNGGRSGNLTINAAMVEVAGTSVSSCPSRLSANTSATGDAGDLTIVTEQLMVRDGGRISAYTRGQGHAGTLRASANVVEVAGASANGTPSAILFDTVSSGDAGDLKIDSWQVFLRDGGQISAATSGAGRGGIIAVNASDAVEISGVSPNGQFASGLYFDSRGGGDARGIRVNTGRLTVQHGGQVTVSGSGTGASGDLEVNAGSIFVSDGGRLTATTQSGEGGNIRLQAKDSIILRRDGDIRTQAYGTGNGGNIRLEAGKFILGVLSEDSDVIASAVTGRGGNIYAKAAGIFGFRLFDRVETPESDFVASSQLGLDGTITINGRDFLPTVPLPMQLAPPPLSQGCLANPRARNSQASPHRFFDARRGGLPPNPAEPLESGSLWEDPRAAPHDRASLPPPAAEPPTRIIEATAISRDAAGNLWLVADETAAAAPQFQPELNCQAIYEPQK